MLKAALGIQIYLAGVVNNKTISVKNSFAGVKGKLCRYFGNMMLAFVFFIPQALIISYFSASNNPYYFLITIPYNCLVFPLYFLLEPTVALEEKDTLKF